MAFVPWDRRQARRMPTRNTDRPVHVRNEMTRDRDWSKPVSEDRIERAAAALRANNIEALVVDTGEDAKREALARIPDGAEVHSGASKTLQTIGVVAELESSPR